MLIAGLYLVAQTAVSQSWTSLGSGMISDVAGLAVGVNGELYASGDFPTTVEGLIINGIAKWNGSSWTNLGNGMDGGIVYTLTVGTNGELYAGGL